MRRRCIIERARNVALQWQLGREAAASPGRFHLRLPLRRVSSSVAEKLGITTRLLLLKYYDDSLRNLRRCRRHHYAFTCRECAGTARYRAFFINACKGEHEALCVICRINPSNMQIFI